MTSARQARATRVGAIVAIGAFLSVAGSCGRTRPATLTARALAPKTRRALAEEVRRSFRQELLVPWYPRAVDYEHGGFLGRFDADWLPAGAQEKLIVSQAGHVWANVRAAERFREYSSPAGNLAHARYGYKFLRDVMWDAERGGFHWMVTREGRPIPERDGRIVKQTYGNAFAILALAAYYDVTHDPEGLALAQRAFRWLDEHAHDPVHGGYFNFIARDGTALRAGYGSDAPKDHRSSIHVLEAFTELYRGWPDPLLRSRVEEMLSLLRDRISKQPGYLTLFHRADWSPVTWRDSSEAARRRDRYAHDRVSFGHDMTTARVLLDASRALGRTHDATTRAAAKRMVDHALRQGWDGVSGGFVEAGYYHSNRSGLAVVDSSKSWWAQAEGLNTLLMMAELFPNDSMRYADRFRQQWAYVRANLIDHARGGWYAGGLDRQPDMRRADKGSIWKSSYHEARSYLDVIRRLEDGGVP